jgi:hypothetical protein
MFEIDMSGMKDLERKLNELSHAAESLDGNHEVPIAELLTPGFLAKHSQFASLDDLIAASGFKVESAEDFKAIPDEPWDQFIKSNTDFDSWTEMLPGAVAEWTAQKLGL